jgi:hypothetical protein
MLSTATRSISGSIGGLAFGPIALSAATPGCSNTPAGLACALTESVPAGGFNGAAVMLATFASSNGTGARLATASATAKVYAGQSNYVAPAFYALAQVLYVRVLATSLRWGQWANDPIIVAGYDAAGKIIPSVSVIDASGTGPIAGIQVNVSGFATCCTSTNTSWGGRAAGSAR